EVAREGEGIEHTIGLERAAGSDAAGGEGDGVDVRVADDGAGDGGAGPGDGADGAIGGDIAGEGAGAVELDGVAGVGGGAADIDAIDQSGGAGELDEIVAVGVEADEFAGAIEGDAGDVEVGAEGILDDADGLAADDAAVNRAVLGEDVLVGNGEDVVGAGDSN